MVSMAEVAHQLGTQLRQKCQLSCLARQAMELDVQMGRATGWDLFSDAATSRNVATKIGALVAISPIPLLHLYLI